MPDWYSGTNQHVKPFHTSTGLTLLDSARCTTSSSEPDVGVWPAAARAVDASADMAAQLDPVITANWQ